MAVHADRRRLAHQVFEREIEQARGRLVRLDDLQALAVDHHHGIGGHLEKHAVARFGLAHFPVIPLHFLLRVDKPLLDRGDGAQIAPGRQHGSAFA